MAGDKKDSNCRTGSSSGPLHAPTSGVGVPHAISSLSQAPDCLPVVQAIEKPSHGRAKDALDTADHTDHIHGIEEKSREEQNSSRGNAWQGVAAKYERIGRIGEGTFGVVYKARARHSGEVVALKRVRMDKEREGIPITSLRELHLLQLLQHPNIVTLREVVTCSASNSIFLVFDYVEHDMCVLLDHMRQPFHESEVKQLLLQLLSAVAHMHAHHIVHRDLKLANLLYSNEGCLHVADFGLARHIGQPSRPLTPRVVTLWYRSPCVLLGSRHYGRDVDMWSVGCIMGELLLHKPLLPGMSDTDQLHRICNLLGSPTTRQWPGMASLPLLSSITLPYQPYNNLATKFSSLSASGLDLLSRFLAYDPVQRITAEEALQHPYFAEHPLPTPKAMMPTFPNLHDDMVRRQAAAHKKEAPALDAGRFAAFGEDSSRTEDRKRQRDGTWTAGKARKRAKR